MWRTTDTAPAVRSHDVPVRPAVQTCTPELWRPSTSRRSPAHRRPPGGLIDSVACAFLCTPALLDRARHDTVFKKNQASSGILFLSYEPFLHRPVILPAVGESGCRNTTSPLTSSISDILHLRQADRGERCSSNRGAILAGLRWRAGKLC